MKKQFLFLFVLITLIFSLFSVETVFAATGTISSSDKYAWGNSCGWLNFKATNGNVSITDSTLTGYVWSEVYGWINLNPTGSGVKNTTSGVLFGSAWGQNTGWINFSGVTINCSGRFKGSATGDVVGTITFDCSNCSVLTDWKPTSGCGGGGGSVILFHNECNAQKQCVSVSGAGTSQCFNSNDCGTHNECNAQKQCVAVSGAGTDLCASNNDCITHNECNAQKQCIAVDGEGDEQCQTDIDCTLTHGKCNNSEQCILVPGFGLNECANDIDCGPTHNACKLQQCVVVPGSDADQCQNNSDCVFSTHNECNKDKCVSVVGQGNNLCQADSDCASTHSECNTQKQCVTIAGAGSDTCQSSNDCAVKIVVTETESHNECNAQKQCVSVSGLGSDLCKADNDCDIVPIKTIQQPIKIIETITQSIEEQIPAPAKTLAADIKKIIETPQGSIITKVVSTTGAVVAAAEIATVIIFSPFELLLLFIRISGAFLTVLGIKKRVRHWGVVYDSVTKQPIDPAYVVLKDSQGKIISSAITDLDGRYGFLEPSGAYQISVNKTNYTFPSQKLAGRINDELYNDLYFGENIIIEQGGETITKNIPMDPLRFDWNEFAKRDKKLMNFYSKIDIALRRIFDLFFIVGFVVAFVAYFAAPYPYNLIILAVYLVLLLLRVIGVKPKAYGRIFNSANGDPMSFAILRIIMPDSNVEIAHKVADKYGRYYCLVPKGKYFVKIEKKNDDGSYYLAYTSPLIDASKKGIIKNTFRI